MQRWVLPVGTIDLENLGTRYSPHIVGTASINGRRIQVLFDTGTPLPTLTLDAAGRAGITPKSPGVVAAGIGIGLGRGAFREWIGPFSSFKIGNEEVRDTRLSHRIYVANSQHKLYFTYKGGRVFNLSARPSSTPPSNTELPSGQGSTAAPSLADLIARGSALVARHQYAQAIAVLTQAAKMDPGDPEALYRRAAAYLGMRERTLALTDLDQTLKLKPDYVDALMTRARLELSTQGSAAARADLDSADRAESRESDNRYELALLYLTIGAPERAVHQLDLWIALHADDARLSIALNDRCWSRVLLDEELTKAEADCNAAVRGARNNANYLDSLGWVHFRRGEFGRSMRDFDAALKQAPKQASSLYGRGIDELRLGESAADKADIATATALAAQPLHDLGKYGIHP